MKGASYKRWIKRDTITIILNIILLCSSNIRSHLTNSIFRMHSLDHRRSKLIVFCLTDNQINTFYIFLFFERNSNKRRISLPSMLDIHSKIIHQIFTNKSCNHIRILTIRIKLYEESFFLDSQAKIWKIWMNRWFSSTDRDSIQETHSPIQKVEKNLLWNMRILICLDLTRNYHLRIVTKSTPKIATSRKYHTRNLTWIIDESAFLKPWKYHFIKKKWYPHSREDILNKTWITQKPYFLQNKFEYRTLTFFHY